jgi:chromosomal replication initiator protein
VLGPSNEMAHAMALAMADRTGRKVNVLFLCGKTGLGKTHLSNAIGHRILTQKPDARVVCVSAETFTNDYVQAIQHKRMEEFRGRYRSACDALLLDDVQFLAGKEGTQDEFFHTFNHLYQRDAPIVLTSDVLPSYLQGMAERLLSRFSQGMVAEISPPEMETRVAILKAKAARENTRIDDEAAFAVASAMNTNVRELEGLLMKLAIKATLAGKGTIDLALVREALKIGARPAVVTVEDIQKAVCEHYRIKLGQLTGRERHREVALPRQVAMFLARVHLGTSFPQLGARFNGKDHTTVISAVRRVEKLLAESSETREVIDSLSLKLGFPPPKDRQPPEGVPQKAGGV